VGDNPVIIKHKKELVSQGHWYERLPVNRDAALETIEIQRQTIELQRDHIRDLNARIVKLEKEANGLTSLL
jgi:uncharacterized protein YigA (DUF484 family)